MMKWLEKLLARGRREVRAKVESPDGRTWCEFELSRGRMSYVVMRGGKVLVRKSNLGFVIAGEEEFGEDLCVVREMRRSYDETWETLVGEEREIRNNYNEVAFYLAEQTGARRLLTVRLRVFNEGVALRYELPAQVKFRQITVVEEKTEFNVDVNSYAWQIPAYQPDRYEYNYERVLVHELKNAVHTPLLLKLLNGFWVAIHEAGLYNYGAMTLKMGENGRLRSDITPLTDGTKAKVELPFATPWRVIMIGNSALDLVTNRMVLNLNEPPKEDFSWVEPLKFMGIWWAMFVGEWTWAPGERHGATTEHALEYIDACKRLGMRGLLVEGWNNGWEGNWLLAGADTVFTEPMADFDLVKVANYAKLAGVELVGHHETVGYIDNYEKQLEAAYEFYRDHGVRYVKSGYAGSMMTVDGRKEFHHSQVGVQHYQKALELAAKYKIMLDVHEPIKGTGLERTWPNLLTREGARGQEYEGGALLPSHVCILPFTRLLAGGMDYTSGIFDVTNGTKRLASTLARQLALYVVIYSGMQMAADRPRFYEGDLAELFEFIRRVPVNFERTVPLLGVVGEYYVVARQGRGEGGSVQGPTGGGAEGRKDVVMREEGGVSGGGDWYVGGVTNEEARVVHVGLEFLEAGVEYEAVMYVDGEGAHYRENQLSYRIERRRVRAEEVLEIWMAGGGGFAMEIRRV